MIKRRFYKLEHADHKRRPSDSSSSSSDSDSDPHSHSDSDADDDFETGPTPPELEPCSPSSASGYESEHSSADEVDIDSSGLPVNDGDDGCYLQACRGGNDELGSIDKPSKRVVDDEPLSADFPSCALKCKSVFKCRLCPRIVCLNEESLRAHLKSKRHSRSEKLLNEGRLKVILNSDGEIDNEDVSAKEEAEVPVVSQDKRKREKGGRHRHHRRRQNNKLKKTKGEQDSGVVKARSTKDSPAKKRRKQEK